jgi:hypothetical protein
MAKKTKAPATKKSKSILNAKSHEFLEKYINNIAPTGFETPGQQMWLDYIRPYIDTHIVDTYGTVVGVINPDAKYKVVVEAHATKSLGSCITLLQMDLSTCAATAEAII